jgi:hypothetical protein
MLFGGNLTDQTWTWNGTTWELRGLAPAPRQDFAMALDLGATPSSPNIVFLHGGNGAAGFSDTWTWDGSGWTGLSLATAPALAGHGMEFDPVRRAPLLFGADPSGTFLTYEWNRGIGNWRQLFPASSPAAATGFAHASFVANTQRQGVVLFGGATPTSAYSNHTWWWDGTTWTQWNPPTAPPARRWAAMAAEPGGTTAVLFGGEDSNGFLGDTWRLDLVAGTWTQAFPAQAPSARRSTRMVMDPARGTVLLFGGEAPGLGAQGDAWEWSPGLSQWQQLTLPGIPGRSGHEMTRGPGGQLVLFGGVSHATGHLGDTWTAFRHSTAAFQTRGTACGAGSRFAPSLTSRGLPYLDSQFSLQVGNLPPGAAVLMLIGRPFVTPVPICPGCAVYVSPLDFLPMVNLGGNAQLVFTIPRDPGLIGAKVDTQAMAVDAAYTCMSGSFGIGLGFSNAASWTIGSY